jgi:hypothetical protein
LRLDRVRSRAARLSQQATWKMEIPVDGMGADELALPVRRTWQLEQGQVVLEPFGKLDAQTKHVLKDELRRIEAFVV